MCSHGPVSPPKGVLPEGCCDTARGRASTQEPALTQTSISALASSSFSARRTWVSPGPSPTAAISGGSKGVQGLSARPRLRFGTHVSVAKCFYLSQFSNTWPHQKRMTPGSAGFFRQYLQYVVALSWKWAF